MLNKINNHLILVALFLMLTISVKAQTVKQNTGWFALFSETRLSNKWGLHFDFQLRTADDWAYLRNVLLRPGIIYYIDKNQQLTAGYLYTTTSLKNSGLDYNLTEHRIWEQYIYKHQISSIFVQHRLRLEQRFIETQSSDVFSQRFRYFLRLIQPLQKKQQTFTHGPFAALQNEVFLNVQNNDKLNGNIFDQNRAYLALGYRFSKYFDAETGYLNQYVKARNNNNMNHVIQLALYARF